MQIFVGFLVVVILLGGPRFGRVVREHPVTLLALCTVAAASFYSLRVVL